ncbi:MAG TPA: HIRAN domain-containing protein [Bacteroidales bacterium]|nr:HIRAN domain-containing protein [Bacteroidales bacterium]
MERRHFIHCRIAGFTFYEAPVVFSELSVGTELQLVAEPDNHYDAHAVAVFFNQHKLGFLPRNENNAVSKLLEMGYADIFETRIQRISPASEPENQVQIIVYLKPAVA